MKIPDNLKKVRDVTFTKQDLVDFEEDIAQRYEDGHIPCPVHLSNGNEDQLINIFQYVHPNDWVFCTWRNHLEALLHGVTKNEVLRQILSGQSLAVHSKNPNLYSSAIVGGIIPIALGIAKAFKMKKSERKAWVFMGDMAFEAGIFYENYKYAKNFNLPIQFVVEDNNKSTYTPTDETWGYKKRDIPNDVIYYQYESKWPHYGTGAWVAF